MGAGDINHTGQSGQVIDSNVLKNFVYGSAVYRVCANSDSTGLGQDNGAAGNTVCQATDAEAVIRTNSVSR